jgi:uncharacterized damage-inducible protein DinB
MNSQASYWNLVRYKQWADRGLHEVAARGIDKLDAQDRIILMRMLDHIHVVDRVFQHHLQGLPHSYRAARSEGMPELRELAEETKKVDAWYVGYVKGLSASGFDETLEFNFTNGTVARMTRGEIILHVGLHGTYHRGNAGFLLQKNGIVPNNDRMTDFLDEAA